MFGENKCFSFRRGVNKLFLNIVSVVHVPMQDRARSELLALEEVQKKNTVSVLFSSVVTKICLCCCNNTSGIHAYKLFIFCFKNRFIIILCDYEKKN